MANKVISIKMDERDIEKIKKYYDALTKIGFLSSQSMSLNAFYKHLLLDYLDDDICKAFEAFSEFGATPKCLDPDSLNIGGGWTLCNTYNLSPDIFEIYQMSVKETLKTSLEELYTHAERFNEVVKADICVSAGNIHQLECYPGNVMEEVHDSFWYGKAIESLSHSDAHGLQENELSMLLEEIEMIKSTSIPNDLKEKLVNEMLQYMEQLKEQLKQKRTILQSINLKR